MFRRFIDDIFTLWLETARQFDTFVSVLNQLSARFGIKFGDCSVGESVNFLDVTLFIDSDGFIQYRLFRKPTDSRLYLRTNSFHPKHVFDSVALSQLHRVRRRNSTTDISEQDTTQLMEDLEKCGYDPNRLAEILAKLVEREDNPTPRNQETSDTLALVVPYFQEINELKDFIHSLKSDIAALTGTGTRTLVAARKGRSVAARVVKNGQLCESDPTTTPTSDQRCGAKGCRTCTLLCKQMDPMVVNGVDIKPEKGLTCKSKNIIYMAQCTLCDTSSTDGEISVYAGQTIQPLHKRMNGHRGCFKEDSNASPKDQPWEKSALSKHAFEEHYEKFDMSIYRIVALKQCAPTNLNRIESKTINDYRLGVLGLNRMKIQKG